MFQFFYFCPSSSASSARRRAAGLETPPGMRRRPGVAGIQRDRELRAKAEAVGAELQSQDVSGLAEFGMRAQTFAKNHEVEIGEVAIFWMARTCRGV